MVLTLTLNTLQPISVKRFLFPIPQRFASIAGSVKRDDGIAIYVNGTEVYRNNLAAGATYTTLATLASDDGATSQTFSFSPSVFINGNNVIAVEIHQNAANSTDISFDLATDRYRARRCCANPRTLPEYG